MNRKTPEPLEPVLMVVIPTLGHRDDALRDALVSCQGLVEQGIASVLVVAPPKAVSTAVIAREFGARVLEDPGGGMANAVNLALAEPTAERYYVWLGDDDRLVASGVIELIGALERDPKAVMAYGACEYIDEGGRVGLTSRAGRLATLLLSWGPNLIPHPGTIIRRNILSAQGGYRVGLFYALDLDLFLRLRRLGRFVHHRAVSAQFRWHSGSMTVADRSASNREAIRVKRSHLPPWLRPISGLWLWPVAWASEVAAKRVSARFRRLAQS